MRATKIQHLCCKPGAKFKAESGKHLYQCSGCGQTKRGTDRTTEPRRDKHVAECFNVEQTRLENEGTQAEFLTAVKAGLIPGVKFNRHGPRAAWYTWTVK